MRKVLFIYFLGVAFGGIAGCVLASAYSSPKTVTDLELILRHDDNPKFSKVSTASIVLASPPASREACAEIQKKALELCALIESKRDIVGGVESSEGRLPAEIYVGAATYRQSSKAVDPKK